jgi:hypothetical protein
VAGPELVSPPAINCTLIHQEVDFLCLRSHGIGHDFRNPATTLPRVRQVHITPGQVPRSDFKVIQGHVEQVFLGVCGNRKGGKERKEESSRVSFHDELLLQVLRLLALELVYLS